MLASSEIAIGELSRRAQCNIETIRYYERIGLVPRARRPGGRYRRYDAADVARLRFIRKARQLGFSVAEIRALMHLAGAEGNGACDGAQRLARAHVADVRTKIADLQAMERALSDAIRQCEAGREPKCPLIEVLSGS